MTRRPPSQVAGKIRFAWGHTRAEGSDWFASWHVPADNRTSKLVLRVLSNLGEELVRRGYRRESIRFECAK